MDIVQTIKDIETELEVIALEQAELDSKEKVLSTKLKKLQKLKAQYDELVVSV